MLTRLLARLLIKLLIIGPLPSSIQAATVLYPASLLWSLLEAPAVGATPAHDRASVQVDPNQNITTYNYDELNRRTKTIFPDQTFTETTYDTLGRRIAEKDQAGRVTQFKYDKVGRLVKVIDAKLQETTYTYDEMGNRLTQTDANGHTTAFEYDKLGRQTARIMPDGSRETMTYDAAGNMKTKADFMGRTISYEYDINNRLLSRSYPNPAENVSFTYTATGLLKTATTSDGTTTYDYDVRDRLQKVTEPSGAHVDFTWDENSNRLTATGTPLVGDPITATYTYDDASRLGLITDATGAAYTPGYDANGNRTTFADPNGVNTTYVYNALNRLTNLTTVGTTTVQSYALTLGPSGNRTRIEEQGGKVRDFTYDELYRLIQEKVTSGAGLVRQEDLTYDAVGNRLTRDLTTTAGTLSTTYNYDNRDRLLTENLATSTWDANGNLLTKAGAATYTWDTENRVIKAELAGGTIVEYRYDAFGARTQTKTTKSGQAPEVINYLLDRSGPLTYVLADMDATSAITSFYLRANDDLVDILRPDGAGGFTKRFVHADPMGSIRALTDESGQVTDTYDYDAWGVLISHVGNDPQPYAFAGEPLDPNTGLQYHRARWMDPASGRFASVDAFEGYDEVPSSLHRYLYVAADPLDRVDPSGREFLIGFSIAASIQNTLAGIEAINGIAIMDQVQYGGNAGLKSLAFQAIVGVFIIGAAIGLKYLSALSRFRNATRFLSGVQVKSFGKVVAEGTVDLAPTLERIEQGVRLPFKNDGAVFRNAQRLLPVQQDANYYQEFVHPTPGVSGPGSQRIVVGRGGEAFYTPDHYASFIPIN